jgi:hypothetical protein
MGHVRWKKAISPFSATTTSAPGLSKISETSFWLIVALRVVVLVVVHLRVGTAFPTAHSFEDTTIGVFFRPISDGKVRSHCAADSTFNQFS